MQTYHESFDGLIRWLSSSEINVAEDVLYVTRGLPLCVHQSLVLSKHRWTTSQRR